MRTIRHLYYLGAFAATFSLYSCQHTTSASDNKNNEESTQINNIVIDMQNLRNAITETLKEMAKKARTMNMQGVAVASVLPKDSDVDWIGEMKIVDTPYNFEGGNKGWNLVSN